MKETLITDLVAQEALDQLKELDDAMGVTLGKFQDCAKELAKGLRITVEVQGDLDKLQQLAGSVMKEAQQAAAQYTQQLEKQQQVVANTTNTISRQLAEQEKLNKATREAYKADDDALTVAQKTLGTREQHYRQMARLTAAMTDNRREQRELNKAEEEGRVTADEAVRTRAELMRAYDSMKYESQQLARLIAVENKEAQAAEGSYEQLSQRLEYMKKAYKAMTDEEKRSAPGQTLEKGIQDLDAHLKDLAADMGEFQRNVGNYAVANKGLKASLREMQDEIASLMLSYQGMTDEERKSAAGRELQDKIRTLTEEAGKYRDAVNDARESVRGSSSDTQALDTLAESGKLLASTMGLASSAAQMLGVSNDSLAQSMLKVQQAMQAVQALTVIQNTLQKQSNIMKGVGKVQALALAAAERIEAQAATQATGATMAQTAAMKAFNAVAKANPYVLLATAIITVVGLIIGYTAATKDATEADEEAAKAAKMRKESMDSMAQSFGNSAGEMIAKYKVMREQWNALGDDIKAKRAYLTQHKSDFDNIAQAVDGASASVKGVSDVENIFNRNTPAVEAAIMKRARAMAAYAEYIRLTQMKLQELEQVSSYKYRQFHAGEKVIRSELEAAGIDIKGSNLGGFLGKVAEGMLIQIDEEQARRLTEWSQRSNLEAARKQQDEIDKRYEQRMKYVQDEMRKNDFYSPASFSGGGVVGSSGSKTGSKTGSKDKAKDEVKAYEDLRKEIDKITLESYKKEEEYTQEWLDNQRQALKKAAEVATAANQERMDKLLAELEKSKKAGKITEEQYAEAEQEIRRSSAVVAINIEDKKNADILKAEQEFAAKRLEILANEAAGAQAARDNEYQMAVASLYSEYAAALDMARKKGEDVEKIADEFNRRRLDLDNAYAIQTAQAQVDALRHMVEDESLAEEEREKLRRELNKATADLAVKRAEIEKDSLDDIVDKEKEAHEKRMQQLQDYVQKAGEVFSKVGEFMGAMYDSQISKVEELLEEEQERYDAEVNHIDWLAERGAITAEEAEIRKRDAAEATEKKQEQLEKKKAALEYKKAVLQKVNSIAEIGIATALGIMQTFATLGWPAGIPGAAFVAAMGALQTATALAQPIKAYKEGTKDRPHPGGLAIVGDGGKAEVVLFGGRAWVTPDSPTLVDLPRGAEVLPDMDRRSLAEMGESLRMSLPRDRHTGQPVIINDYHALEERVAANTKSVTKELKNLRSGIARELRNQRFQRYINERI